MTREITTDDLQELLNMLEGARLASMTEQIMNGEMEAAVRYAGEANGYHRMRKIVDKYVETGDLPDFMEKDNWQAYADMAGALNRADDAVNGDDRHGRPEVGVE